MKILLASPMGFCAGVDRAIKIVDKVIETYDDRPIYVRHEIVHNKYVVDSFIKKGVKFVDDIDEIPNGSVLIFSAHGVSREIKSKAEEKQLKLLIDATCPLVTKIHLEVMSIAKKGFDCVLIGHRAHVEVDGTLGHFDQSYGGNIYLVGSEQEAKTVDIKNTDHLFYVTQTTLSVDETKNIIYQLKERFPKIQGPKKDDICYATQNRQDALKALSKISSVVLVVGSSHSSNTTRLLEISQKHKPTYLISSCDELNPKWFEGKESIGITAGASTPSILVDNVISKLQNILNDTRIEVTPIDSSIEENIEFLLPQLLR